MNLFVILSFVLLGIAAFVIQKKRRFEQIDVLHVLLISAIALLLKADFNVINAANTWTYSLIALIAINFLLSRWDKLRTPIIRLVPALASFAILFGLFWNDSFVYLGNIFNISDKATFALPFLGIIIVEFAWLKLHFLKKIFGLQDSFINVLMPLLVGLTVLIGAFNAGGYGVFLVGTGFLTASFYNSLATKHIIHSFLAISVIWTFAAQSNIEIIDLRFAKVIAGLFVGAFVAGFVLQMWFVEKRKTIALLITYILLILLITGLLFAGVKINPSFGGVEAYLGGLMGFALANSVIYLKEEDQELQQAPIMMSTFVLLMLIGLIVSPMLVNKEELEVQKSLNEITPKGEKGEEIEIPYIAFDGLSGSYTIVEETALISFKLGPAGSVTKGAIKEFSGTFNFTEDITKTTFDIKLPVLNLTTFLAMRDKSIMGEDYFSEEKFPLMRFKGSSMSPTKIEHEYEMTGNFEMLGVKAEQKVLLNRIEEDGKNVLIGSGEIDRRKFGMADDPREGNIVSFEFKVELK